VVLGCVACQHQFGSVAEKDERKVGCPARGGCYSLSLHTPFWTVEENTCLGEEVGGPGCLGVYVCLQCTFTGGLAKLTPSACSAC
jgi:TPP-dependent indolepyruvate ferredoxin oxidoreductase alpha subunit